MYFKKFILFFESKKHLSQMAGIMHSSRTSYTLYIVHPYGFFTPSVYYGVSFGRIFVHFFRIQ